jgi:hypothetical protein
VTVPARGLLQCGGSVPTWRRTLLPPSSGQKVLPDHADQHSQPLALGVPLSNGNSIFYFRPTSLSEPTVCNILGVTESHFGFMVTIKPGFHVTSQAPFVWSYTRVSMVTGYAC